MLAAASSGHRSPAGFSAGLRCCALADSITAAGDAGAAAASPARRAGSRSAFPCPAAPAEPVNQCQRSPEQILLPVRAMGETTQMVSTPNLLDYVRTQFRGTELGLLPGCFSWQRTLAEPSGAVTSGRWIHPFGLEEEGCPKTDRENWWSHCHVQWTS